MCCKKFGYFTLYDVMMNKTDSWQANFNINWCNNSQNWYTISHYYRFYKTVIFDNTVSTFVFLRVRKYELALPRQNCQDICHLLIAEMWYLCLVMVFESCLPCELCVHMHMCVREKEKCILLNKGIHLKYFCKLCVAKNVTKGIRGN